VADSAADGPTRAETSFLTTELALSRFFAESKRRRRVANSISRRPEITELPNHLLGLRGGRYLYQADPLAAVVFFSREQRRFDATDHAAPVGGSFTQSAAEIRRVAQINHSLNLEWKLIKYMILFYLWKLANVVMNKWLRLGLF